MPSWKKVITSGSDASLNSLVVSDTFQVNGVEHRTFTNSNLGIGINTVASFQRNLGYAAHFDYLIRTNTDLRAGKIVVVWSNSTIRITDTSTVDIGNTAGAVFDVNINTTATPALVELELALDSAGWVFKSDCKIL